ncbi:DUF2927 domain-containing protein [Shewanella baltica]|uniref:DUF2927 domain-containing protein n=1 Tax=Shewanella baltica TaxID=62322 RepID=UPI00217EF4E1|nr:DUF2927 domain-containing protein [Shewanella baltica]MCS6097558.1 DUF2927 domain-containing protein [Shewanella baltica]MCS6228666.1 DUF2927 domain-containing protein [Shewanella baltica]
MQKWRKASTNNYKGLMLPVRLRRFGCSGCFILGLFFATTCPLYAAQTQPVLIPTLTPVADWKNLTYITQAFSEIALKNEYDVAKHKVRKWRIPVRVFVEHQVGDRALHTQLVQMHLAHLAEITGHDIQLVDTLLDANLHLVFTRQSQWESEVMRLMGPSSAKNVHGSVCMAKFALNAKSEIERAWVIIPVDQAQMHGKLVACVVEEITQVLGLPNDSEKVFPSIFNDKTPQDLLTGLDFILLKLLYSPNIRAGMTAAEVKAPLQILLEQWQRDDTLINADKTVRQGQLYPLLGY